MGSSSTLQVSRRAAVTTLAVATVAGSPCASGCVRASTQCWVERLVRTGCALTVKAPSATAAQKFTVSDSGSPNKAGCCSTAFSRVAAVMPPKGPTMLA